MDIHQPVNSSIFKVFGTLHFDRLREASKSMNRLTHINPTVVKGIQEIKEELSIKYDKTKIVNISTEMRKLGF